MTTPKAAIPQDIQAKADMLVAAKLVSNIDEALTFLNYKPGNTTNVPANETRGEKTVRECNRVAKFPSREAAMETALMALAAMQDIGKQGPCGHYHTGLWTIMPFRTKNNECAIVTIHGSMANQRLMSNVVPDRVIERIRSENLRPKQGDSAAWADICMPVRRTGKTTIDTPEVLLPIKAVHSQGNGVMLDHALLERTNKDEEVVDLGGGKMARLGPDVGNDRSDD